MGYNSRNDMAPLIRSFEQAGKVSADIITMRLSPVQCRAVAAVLHDAQQTPHCGDSRGAK